MEFVITGQPFSKANQRRMFVQNSKLRSIKSEKALAYQESALWQLKKVTSRHKPFTVPVAVKITIYYPDRRQDLDPSLILDIMQKAGVYENDRLVQEMHLFRSIDKTNPRSEIAIWKIQDE